MSSARNRTIVALTLALALALMTACGAEVRESGGSGDGDGGTGGSDDGPIQLAVVPRAVGFSFWNQVRLGAECAAQTADGDVEVQWDGVTAETDVNGQVNLLQNFITQGVDGIVYSSTDEQVLADVSQQAIDQDIVVTNINTGTRPQPEGVPLFTTDQEAATRKAVEPLAEAIGGEGQVAIVEFQPGLQANEERVEPLKEGLEENYPEIEIVAEQSSESDYNTALQVTQDIMTANPDLDAVFGANEPSVLGAAEAVRNADMAGEIAIIGWDASSEEIEALRAGVIQALVAQNPFQMGYDGTNAAVEEVRTGESVEGGDTGSYLITEENVDDEEIQALLDPTCENPPIEDES